MCKITLGSADCLVTWNDVKKILRAKTFSATECVLHKPTFVTTIRPYRLELIFWDG